MATIKSNQVTFVDLTESRKLDVYISSNLPTTQIRNTNDKTYTPDWSVTNLTLSADIFLDSKKLDTVDSIVWYEKIGAGAETQMSTNKNVTISTNKMSGDSASIITYICKVEYQNLESQSQITFTRTDTGLNGSNGNSAPAVLAQYSADGVVNWTSTLNTTTHKYIRHSYDGGKTWSAAIKMVGEDGTSVRIIGTATSATPVTGTDYYTLVYSSASITSAEFGDAYLYNGDLYVCADSRDGQDYFINVGNIQGPSGNDGKSSYVFIRYATDANGTNMSISPSGKTYMGVCTVDTNVAPTTANSYTWSKFVGDNAKSIVLSGDSQVFKISQSNAVTPSTIKVAAQAFNTTITNWSYSTNGGQTFLSTVPDGVSRNGNIVTVTGSSITSNSLTIKASDGTIEDVFTVYKAFDGSDGNPGNPGAPAPIAFLTNENVTFSANAQGQITGTTITSNIVAYNGTTKVTPTIGTISGAPTGMTIASSTVAASNEVMLTITIANNSTLGSASSNMGVISIPVTYPVSTVLYLTWSKVNTGATGTPGNPGSPAYTAILTNESHVFAGDVSNAIDGSATTQVLAYKGATAQTVTISSVNGKAAATADTDTGIAGLKFKCSALSGASPTITFTCTTSFVSANGTIPIVFTVDGVSFTKMFTYSIAFKGDIGDPGSPGQPGSPGVPATSYWLVSSASVVQKTSTGTIAVTPSTLTFTAKSQTGTATPTDYACRWIIAYSTDGTNYTDLYTSSANESSKSITVATTYKTVRVRMYLAGGTSTLLDEQIIPVVSDGAKGDTGVGISSVTVTYGTSTSASTQPTSWQATMPTVAEGSYLWTRTITDYTDSSIADTVTYTYAKQGAQGGIGPQGTSVAVSSIQYQAGTSATVAPTGTWSNSVVTVAEGSYLWTKTTFSDGKIAYGVARQGIDGDDGKGITSIVEQYYQSTSATTQSGGSWSTTVPTWADGKYIWTRSVITYTDATTTTTSPVCVTGQKGSIGGTGIGVSSVDVWYYQSTSATALSGGSWSTTAPTWSDGQYIWTKTITTYTNNTTDETNAVCITGQKGATGVGVKSVTEYYLATASSSGVTTSTSGWTTSVQTITTDKKYLWNYEIITYTNNTTSTTTPVIIGVFGNTGDAGKGIKSITEYYLATASSSNVTTSTTGWTTTMQTLTSAKKYLWNYELITYTDNTTATISPVIIGVYGDQGVASVSFQVYAPNGYLLTKELESLTLQTFAYEGSTAITSGATYQWSQFVDNVWTAISGATSTTLTVTKEDVLKAKSYRCVMTYKSQTYTSTVTVQDKTDTYNSIMCISSNDNNNDCYWVLYTLVYSDYEEVDPLLGPISITAPSSPMNGDYWYSVDSTNAMVMLKKYNGTNWENSTDTQSLSYYWDMINDGSTQIPLGDSAKVKVVSCNDFTATATLVCEVSNVEDGLLTQSSLSITDASDPIVSESEPTATINGQIWIKPNSNGTYLMFVWDASLNNWISSDMDTRNKVYTSRPSSYNAGDLWITASDTDHGSYLHGTLLQAQKTNASYVATDWSPTLRYDQDIDDMKNTLNSLSQYVTITSAGLRIGARGASGELSPFTSLFTSTELSFYQNSEKLLTLANNQLTAPRIVVEDDLEVQGSISLGDLKIIIESNGSFSFAVQK